MIVAYRGNFQPDLPPGVRAWSTETEIERGLLHEGHTVVRVQEDRESWLETVAKARDADLFLWTSTQDYANRWDRRDALLALDLIGSAIPTVQWHADIWFDLAREDRVHTEPMFRCQLVCTADGGHDDRWAEVGVTHHWLPPAASREDGENPGTPRREYESDIAFIGSWQGYHPESRHRFDLVRHLQRRGAALWPRPGEPAIRGEALRDLVASVKVHVADVCFGGRVSSYWSDRAPYLTANGALLLHPRVEGMEAHFADGEHVVYWDAGDWGHLDRLVAHYLAHPEERERIGRQARVNALARHTFDVRVRELVATLEARGLLPTKEAA